MVNNVQNLGQAVQLGRAGGENLMGSFQGNQDRSRRNALSDINMQNAQFGQQQQQSQAKQAFTLKRIDLAGKVAQTLRNLPQAQRLAEAQRLEGQFGSFVKPGDIANEDLTDVGLDQAISKAKTLLSDPRVTTELGLKKRTLDLREKELTQRGELLKTKPEREGDIARAKLEAGLGVKADVAKEVAEATVLGKAKGSAIVDLPQVLATADESLTTIDAVLSHPGLDSATGLEGVINPKNFVPGTEAHDFALAAEQLQGQAFLVAFQSLRGGGQITETEGKKATAAIAQLSRKQSTPQYRKALRTLRDIIVRAKDRAIDKADAAPKSEFDPALLEFMTPEERALFSGT